MSLAQIKRTLIVCPSVVVLNWQAEAAKWAPEITWVAIRSRAHLEAVAADPPPAPYALSLSWGLLRLVREPLASLALQAVVADEIHYASGLDSQRTQALLWLGQRLSCTHRIGLTGTEVRNRPKELWPLLRFVDPLRFRAFTRFGERFCGPRWKKIPGGRARTYEGASHVKQLNRLLRGYALRREKTDVLTEVPPKTRAFVPVLYSPGEQARVAATFAAIKKRIGLEGTAARAWALGRLGRLRQEAGIAKVGAAAEWISEARANGEPVVVFLYHTEVHEQLLAELAERKIKALSIVGSTSMPKRQRFVQAFMDGAADVIIGSTAMKEGVTLTRSRLTLHIERWWVPADEEQAEDRTVRIGQHRAVVNTYLHLQGSIDDYVAKLVEEKRGLLQALHDRTPLEGRMLQLLGLPE
jgi:SNF2 family DNA or RNA helicase